MEGVDRLTCILPTSYKEIDYFLDLARCAFANIINRKLPRYGNVNEKVLWSDLARACLANILALNAYAHHDIITLPMGLNQNIPGEVMDVADDITGRIPFIGGVLSWIIRGVVKDKWNRLESYRISSTPEFQRPRTKPYTEADKEVILTALKWQGTHYMKTRDAIELHNMLDNVVHEGKIKERIIGLHAIFSTQTIIEDVSTHNSNLVFTPSEIFLK